MLFYIIVLFSCPIMSNSSRPHGLQHTRPPSPSPSLKVCPSSCPLHWWCHAVISSSDTPFSFCPQSFPASGTFPMSQLFTSDDCNTGVSASASVFPMRSQGWFPLRLTSLISFAVQRAFMSLLQHYGLKASILWCSDFFTVQLSKLYVTTCKTIPLTIGTFVSRIMSLLSNTLSRLVIAFLPRSNHLSDFMAAVTIAVILESKRNLSLLSPFPPLFAMK